MKVKGSCLCGDISFECEVDDDTPLRHCHCSMCRTHHGSAFATFLSVKESQFRWLPGEERLARYRVSPESAFERTFCPGCGASGPALADGWGSVPAGWLDSDPGIRPSAHIFTHPEHKAPWFEITDDVEQHDEYTQGQSLPVIENRPAHDESPPDVAVGSCLCGAVIFHITEPFPRIHNCHCTRCQKGRGAAHATNGIGPSRALTFVKGEDNLSEYVVAEAETFKQVFCRTCGSLMPERYPHADLICVSLGALDSTPGRGADDNIFVAYKAPWYEITDGLLSYEEGPPSYL